MKSEFPSDLLVVSGLPLIAVVILVSSLINLQGIAWLVAYGFGVLAALAGAALIFKAKPPAFNEGQFFTFGARALPECSKTLYRRGMLLSLTGCALCLLLLIGSLTWR